MLTSTATDDDTDLTFGHYLLGLEGLALLRQAHLRDGGIEPRVAELTTVAARLGERPFSLARGLPSMAARDGYDTWADTYDGPTGNVTTELEQAAVAPLLDVLPPGRVLDAGCGTGRHTERLLGPGRTVVGVDVSPRMLRRAAQRLPAVEFVEASIDRLPFEDASFDAVVSGLVLSHLPHLGAAVRELGRVLAVGGRAIISNPHPVATAMLGFQARFDRPDGSRAFVPEHAHSHGETIAALGAAGLLVESCIEPVISRDMARAKANFGYEDAYEAALAGLPAVIVWVARRVR